MRKLLAPAALAVLLGVACGGDLDHCAEACQKAQSCGGAVATSFECGKTTAETCEANARWDDCAHCVTEKACGALTAGACDAECK